MVPYYYHRTGTGCSQVRLADISRGASADYHSGYRADAIHKRGQKEGVGAFLAEIEADSGLLQPPVYG